MVSSRLYDWLYRIWAPWDRVGVRDDLVGFLDQWRVTPDRYPRAVDLGCGTGANVVHLARQGFEATGVDFSRVAIGKARRRAQTADVDATFVNGDLTSPYIDGVAGRFDLLIDFGTLDDMRGDARRAMATTIDRLARPGSLFLEYCFYGRTEELPRISLRGTSRLSHIAPGELETLFGATWDVTPFREYPDWKVASFVLTRR